jgi:MFS family permease
LFNVTLGVLISTIDGSITLIAMPDIFRGIGLDPLLPGNSFYLLWMILGFLVVTSVLVVNFGRLGDLYGRVKLYNLGFVLFTFFSLLLTITWMTGRGAAIWLMVMRVFQGVGAALLLANSGAIVTDAFPEHQRGMALGINNAAAISGTFIGLVLGGVLAPVNWRLIFLVSVPIGLFGSIWAYLKLEERGERVGGRVDWPGNVLFALGLIGIMIGLTYGIEPYGGHATGWESPLVLGALLGGVALLVAFVFVESRVDEPMFRLPLFRIRAFSAGSLSTLLSGIARGGLMFILIIWLQGIWLPLHGYSFEVTPLWAGVYILPLTVGFMAAGPISGYLSDRYGSRPFATGGMVVAAVTFVALTLLPINFSYPVFALVVLANGISFGLFASPNRAGVMNSLPARHRGVGGAMNSTFQNSSQVLSIGIFFSLMILGLSSSLPHALTTGLTAQGVPAAAAHRIANLPPVSILFSAFLGYNPMKHLLGAHVLSHLTSAQQSLLVGRSYFPHLITSPFRSGLDKALIFSAIVSVVTAGISWLRGGRYVYTEPVHHPRRAPREVESEAIAWQLVSSDGAGDPEALVAIHDGAGQVVAGNPVPGDEVPDGARGNGSLP